MVSRMNMASLRQALALLILLAALLLPFSGAQARNPYEYTDVVEGDPGDGVLQPGPEVVPDPKPNSNNFSLPVFQFILIDLGNHQYLPVFQVLDFSDGPVFAEPLRLVKNTSDWRWHRAP